MPSALTRTRAAIQPPESGSGGGILPSLYRHCLGTVHTPYYIPHFERFDALGHVVPTWNSSAALFTLSWLIFRRMWRPAFVYMGCVLALLMIWWGGIHRQVPLPMEAALVLLVVLVMCLVPGFMGNALYYRTVHNHTMRALAKSKTLAQAIAKMRQRAVTKTRLYVIAVLHILCFGWLGWTVATEVDWQSLHFEKPLPVPTEPVGPPQLRIPATTGVAPLKNTTDATPSGSVAGGGSGLTSYTTTATGGTAGNASTAYPTSASTASDPMSGLTALASAPASAGSTSSTAYPGGAAGNAGTGTPGSGAGSSTAYPGSPGSASAAHGAGGTPALSTLPMAAPPNNAPTAPPTGTRTPRASTPPPPPAPSRPATPARPSNRNAQGLEPGKFYVNAGVYAQPANAQRAAQALRDADYPVISQPVQGTQGGLTRLRLGPFNSRQEAQEAAIQANLRNIDTSVFQQPR